MYINVSLNIKGFVLLSIIGGLGYMLYTKESKIKSLTNEIEEMNKMKGV